MKILEHPIIKELKLEGLKNLPNIFTEFQDEKKFKKHVGKVIIDALIEERKRLWRKKGILRKDREFTENVACLMTDKFYGDTIFDALRDESFKMVELFFRIRNKKGVIVPFFFNEAQKIFVTEFAKEIKKNKILNKQTKFILLKARQAGFSSVAVAINLASMIIQSGFNGFLLAHDDATSKDLHSKKTMAYFEELPECLKHPTKYSNAKEIIFDKLNSEFKISTAGSSQTGRGGTKGVIILSEFSFFVDPDAILAGAGSGLATDGVLLIESTANGMNGYYNLCKEAMNAIENNYEHEYFLLFIPWYKTKEYWRKFKDEDEKRIFLKHLENVVPYRGIPTKFMRILKRIYDEIGLELEQIYWYLSKYQDYTTNKELIFQEYPTWWRDAFLYSGRPIFEFERLEKLIEENTGRKYLSKTFEHGIVKIFEKPKKNARYVISADVAEGHNLGDDSAFTIWKEVDDDMSIMVCSYTGTIDPIIFGQFLVSFSSMYNDALIAPEVNSMGLATVGEVRRLGGNIYKRENLENTREDLTADYGVRTTASTKKRFILNFGRCVNKGWAIFNDNVILREAQLLTEDERGNIETKGSDIFMAAVIGLYVIRSERF